ncbi:hypothetical protein LC085_01240 [Bacillus tianshenii]|uniref:hypothetical protein n=1 Tax=Sutcliffiella tianshenii TaxID=1463404 RepID=UPI001CD62B51|nr:hypothetical protein [Bacillus tianshenii]MCA1318516.1 hypothetical protein [Bacillus tianshenii]
MDKWISSILKLAAAQNLMKMFGYKRRKKRNLGTFASLLGIGLSTAAIFYGRNGENAMDGKAKPRPMQKHRSASDIMKTLQAKGLANPKDMAAFAEIAEEFTPMHKAPSQPGGNKQQRNAQQPSNNQHKANKNGQQTNKQNHK